MAAHGNRKKAAGWFRVETASWQAQGKQNALGSLLDVRSKETRFSTEKLSCRRVIGSAPAIVEGLACQKEQDKKTQN